MYQLSRDTKPNAHILPPSYSKGLLGSAVRGGDWISLASAGATLGNSVKAGPVLLDSVLIGRTAGSLSSRIVSGGCGIGIRGGPRGGVVWTMRGLWMSRGGLRGGRLS